MGSAAGSADGQWLASGYWDNTGGHRSDFRIWSAADGQTVRHIPMGNCKPCFSPDGRWLLAATEKEFLQFAIGSQPTNWPLIRSYPRQNAGFISGSAAFTADGKMLALQADKRNLSLREAATGRELATLTAIPQTMGVDNPRFSHHGRWLAVPSHIGLQVWDLALIREHLREMNLDWDGPPDLPPPTPAGNSATP
jgi:WD40 repeat protein